MSSRMTMILAGLFLLGALVAGYWGIVLGKSASPPPAAAPAAECVAAPSSQGSADAPPPDLLQPVVVLARDVPPYAQLTAADLTVEKVRIAPPGSVATTDKVIGRSTWRALPAGTWLGEDVLSAGGPLSRMIHPNERALAVAVDEVIGAAGQIAPGDYVDVMLYLRQEQNNPSASAQVVIPAVRVLSIGDQMGLANDGRPATVGTKGDDQPLRTARTVVLAVPQAVVTRLMLAAQAGTLRLAVRSVEEKRLARYWANQDDSAALAQTANRQLLEFSQLAMTSATPAAGPVAGTARRAMEVIRGNQQAEQASTPTQPQMP